MNATKGDWQRVSKRRRCPICAKADWCTYVGPDYSPEVVCCMRVESDRPAKNGGWLHRLRDSDDWRRPTRRRVRTVASTKPDERPIKDFGGFARQCHLTTMPDVLRRFADSLGLSRENLGRLLVGWSIRNRAWTFPMSDAAGHIVGVRLRLPSGRKLAVKGGREGLFVPGDLQPGGRLLICEGPTDCGALLDLDFAAIGRPSCSGGSQHVVELVKRLRPAEAVVVADGDRPGRLGAERLASILVAYVPTARTIQPPNGLKDARAWKAAGATHGDMAAAIDAAEPRRLSIIVKGG